MYPYSEADVERSPVPKHVPLYRFRLRLIVSAENIILLMDSPPTIMTDRVRQGREPLPNLRGEDETEISYLTNLIEGMFSLDLPNVHHCWQAY
jgi:hypothetical protein